MQGIWQEAIGHQFTTALDMLREAIDKCPDALWDDRTDGTPFWHIAYHTLFFADFYLSDTDKDFVPQGFHVEHYHFLPGDYGEWGGVVGTPDEAYSRAQLQGYCDHCRVKCERVFGGLTDERANELCGFHWYHPLNVGQFLLNNLRHVQHHAGQLALILRRRAGIGVEWLGRPAG